MFAYETQILQRLAVLVVFHDLAVGQISSRYSLIQTKKSWFEARDFCQRHYVDLAVLSMEEQYYILLNATAASEHSFWLGLQRQGVSSRWRWLDGEELSYEHWHRTNYGTRCATLEAMLKKDKKLLARRCGEQHMFVCQGPVSPQPVTVDSVGSDLITLAWNVSAFMQMTPHCYNVTTCADTCDTLLLPYTEGLAVMNITISNLTSATEYFIQISAVVDRPDSVSGENMTLQSQPAALRVTTVDSFEQLKVIILVLKFLKLVSFAPPLWVLYCFLKKELNESYYEVSPVELSTQDTIVELIPEKPEEGLEIGIYR